MIYDRHELKQLRKAARYFGLSAPSLFWRAKLSTLAELCNGFGSESFPKPVRKLFDWLYRKYKVIAAIHDVDYELSDGTERKRALADERFRTNAYLMWRQKYGKLRFVNPIALWERRKLRIAYKMLRLFGSVAWNAAYTKNKGTSDV